MLLGGSANSFTSESITTQIGNDKKKKKKKQNVMKLIFFIQKKDL